MAELQTIGAAIQLGDLAIRAVEFFRNVRHAHETAQKLYRRIRNLHNILQDVQSVIHRRQHHRQGDGPSRVETDIEARIKESVEASSQILLKIDKRLWGTRDLSTAPFSQNVTERVKLVLREPIFNRLLGDLDAQISALQTSLGALQLVEQAETRRVLSVNHSEVLRYLVRLDRRIVRANERLDALARFDPSQLGNLTAEGDVEDGSEGLEALELAIRTAQTVRTTYGSEFDPDGQTLLEGGNNIEQFSGDEEDHGDSEDENQRNTSNATVPILGHKDPLDPPTNPNIDFEEPTPPEILDRLIRDFIHHAESEFKAENFVRAEKSLIEALNHVKEREELHGTPYEGKTRLQQMLAETYWRLKHWSEAKKILHELLQTTPPTATTQDGGAGASSAALDDSDAARNLERSTHNLLLAKIHHDHFVTRMGDGAKGGGSAHEDRDLVEAERYAKRAFNIRYRLLGGASGPQSRRPDDSLVESVRTLIQIYEQRGRHVLADGYRRQFFHAGPDGDTSSVEEPVPVDPFDVFLLAVESGDQDEIGNLLPKVDDVNRLSAEGRTPLMYSRDEATVGKLVAGGADINAHAAQGSALAGGTFLHGAAAEGNYRLCQALLGLDARIEATDKNKATPLLLAVERNRPTVVSLLLRYGANPRVRDYAGWTLLHHAAHNNATDILEQLLYTYANNNANGSGGGGGSGSGSSEISGGDGSGVSADLAAPDVDATCPAKKTALHHCADLTLYDSAKVLLQHGADPNKLDIANRTPLWFAVSKPCDRERRRFVALLLEYGAAPRGAPLPRRARDYDNLPLAGGSGGAQQHSPLLPGSPRKDSFTSHKRRDSSSTSGTSANGGNESGRKLSRIFSRNSRRHSGG